MYKQYEKVSYNECLKYVRKSRSDDPAMTLEEVLMKQNMEIDEFSMRELGGIVPESQTYQEIKSSETIEGRPEMCKLLKEIENPKVRGVIVRGIDRLSRGDLMDAGLIIRAFRFTNTLIITPSQTYDLNDESDRMLAEMYLKAGNQYLEYSKKVMKRGKDIAAMNGEFIAKDAPYGYQKDSYKDGRRNVKTLKIDSNEAETISLIFDSYANKNLSMGEIATLLNDMAIKPRFKEFWARNGIAEILMNPVYMGKIRWNYRIAIKTWEDQKMVTSYPRRSLDDCMLVDGKHEAIISEDLFWRANNRKSQNVPLKKNSNLSNPLAGMFYCAKCGKAMKMKPTHNYNKPVYECTEMKHCGNGSVMYGEVMESLTSALKDYIEDFKVSVSGNNNEEIERHKLMINSMEKRLADVEKKELSLWDKYAEEGMPKPIFDKLLEKVVAEKKELQDALKNAYASMPSKEEFDEKIMSYSAALDSLLDDSISANAKNTLLRSIIGKMTLEREKSVRTKDMSAEDAEIAGMKRDGAWYRHPFKLDIMPKV